MQRRLKGGGTYFPLPAAEIVVPPHLQSKSSSTEGDLVEDTGTDVPIAEAVPTVTKIDSSLARLIVAEMMILAGEVCILRPLFLVFAVSSPRSRQFSRQSTTSLCLIVLSPFLLSPIECLPRSLP